MIDIDIIGQLFPNPLTVVVQLCSTAVLFLIVRKFLWGTVTKFLDQRGEKLQEDLTAAEEAKTAALEDRTKALEQLHEASKKSEDIVGAAVKEAKSQKEQILQDAKGQAAATVKRAQEQIEAERQEMYKSMRTEMVNVALDAAEKLIGEKSDTEMDRDAVNAFVREAEKK